MKRHDARNLMGTERQALATGATADSDETILTVFGPTPYRTRTASGNRGRAE
jgi:hypothetical protein